MKAFAALIHREFLEHRGAFLTGPLILVGILFGATILAFTVGRVDARFSGALFTLAPLRVYEVGFLGLGFGWLLYLLVVLVFYCADGFAADKRNNAMLFWKSMPVSDFRMLLSKLTAALTILPGTVFGITLLSGLLLYGVAFTTMLITGTGSWAILGNIASVYGQVAFAILVTLVCGLLWYLPLMGIAGGLATALGRWAIPVSALLPALISLLEWVTLGGGIHPFATKSWAYFQDRLSPPNTDYLDSLFVDEAPFSAFTYATTLIEQMDWLQVGLGVLVALAALYIASEYRRRAAAN
ncbi:hypothetical protein [Devosia sp. SD17-2]|jgi:ABC-2 type transport system permease protein|uniref:hypothetical protein n=1 Tax=Devosia sp. SD17-2 TaxID=2976459 RepID=UPI0023D81DEA|nr:hypothetical protein [Devosia sp. SD17-2]WEJ33340.1 hypothetical protein NYQ88_00505 [Devosia sp. SD17-2]